MKRSLAVSTVSCIVSALVWAQGPPPQLPTYAPQELDQLVAPYAL
jgi:hypothetical protein